MFFRKTSIMYVMTLFCAFAMQVCALTGTIVSESMTPVEGVKITVIGKDTTLLTDYKGYFNFKHITSVISSDFKQDQSTLTISSNEFTIKLIEKASVALTLHNCKGQKLFEIDNVYSEGVTPITFPKLADGIYFLSGAVGVDVIHSQRFIWQGGKADLAIDLSRNSHSTHKVRGQLFKDTIMISKNGYETQIIAVTGYEDNLDTIFIKSTLHLRDQFVYHMTFNADRELYINSGPCNAEITREITISRFGSMGDASTILTTCYDKGKATEKYCKEDGSVQEKTKIIDTVYEREYVFENAGSIQPTNFIFEVNKIDGEPIFFKDEAFICAEKIRFNEGVQQFVGQTLMSHTDISKSSCGGDSLLIVEDLGMVYRWTVHGQGHYIEPDHCSMTMRLIEKNGVEINSDSIKALIWE